MKYLKLFNTHTEYVAFTQTEDFIKPNVTHCVQENEVHYNPWSWADEYLTFVAKGNGTFTFTPQSSNVISYSIDDGETWIEGNSVSVNNGDKVMWKGIMTPQSSQGIGKFSSTTNFDVQGNIMSLLYGNNYKGQTDLTGKDYVFYRLFNNSRLVNAKSLSLPATTLANGCYNCMFQGCTSLTTAPELPATILTTNCYRYMFQGCTSLTVMPELLATTLADYCYASMFSGCTSLITALELPATTLVDYCYNQMFYSCTSLTTAPTLPATILADYCYDQMFYGCTNLTTAPVLPATTLADYCYRQMFYGCTSLTVEPELPATTLANYCYAYMFQGCTSLTTASQLPATTLTDYCYAGMFKNCRNLTTTPNLSASC